MNRHRVAGLMLGAVVLAQVLALRQKVPFLPPTEYCGQAVTLRVWAGQTLGYQQTIHGNVLVRTRNPPPACVAKREPLVAEAMATELHRLPKRLALELGFYAALCLASAYVALPLLQALDCRSSSRTIRAVAFGFATTAMVLLIALPRFVTGYGGSMFTTWAGPYPEIFGGMYPYRSHMPGETVSYRALLEVTLLPAMKLGHALGPTSSRPVGQFILDTLWELLPLDEETHALIGWTPLIWCIALTTFPIGLLIGLVAPRFRTAPNPSLQRTTPGHSPGCCR
jgi:hypothetical protein